MKPRDFTEQPEVFYLIKELRSQGIPHKEFSDVLDSEGHQYVDLVQEGGGVLGAALVGYMYVMEEMGIRFLGLAGTSAGAINALLAAAIGKVNEAKSERLIEELADMNVYDFVDGNAEVKKFLKALIDEAGQFQMIVTTLRIAKDLFTELGLNQGDRFYAWVTEILHKEGIYTTKDLMHKLSFLPEGLRIREGVDRNIEGLKARLAIIASDITTQTKVVFPAMRSLYWENPDEVNPACYLRASMSIPLFFTPYRIAPIPKGIEAMHRWYDWAKFKGTIPDEVVFVDGGIMSNFPIDVFHKSNTPRMPTFGVRLGGDREHTNEINNLLGLIKAIFNSSREVHDFDFLFRNKDYQKLIEHVHVGDHSWLNFQITNADKKDLFVRGAQAAGRFLQKFNWDEYKRIRAKKAD